MIVKKVPVRTNQLNETIKVSMVWDPLQGKYVYPDSVLNNNIDIIKLVRKHVYYIDNIMISTSLPDSDYFSSVINNEFQLLLNKEPLFKKPLFLRPSIIQANNEFFQNNSNITLRAKFTGELDQIAALIGETQIDIFVSFTIMQITNQTYIKKFWGALKKSFRGIV